MKCVTPQHNSYLKLFVYFYSLSHREREREREREWGERRVKKEDIIDEYISKQYPQSKFFVVVFSFLLAWHWTLRHSSKRTVTNLTNIECRFFWYFFSSPSSSFFFFFFFFIISSSSSSFVRVLRLYAPKKQRQNLGRKVSRN